MSAGVLIASADGSFGCAQDDETGAAVEAVGVNRAVALKTLCSSCAFLSPVILSEVEGSIQR